MHQFRRRKVVDAPQAGDHRAGARFKESSRQSDRAFAVDATAARRFTPAEHDEVGIQMQILDFVQPQKTILRSALFVDQRQHEPRELRRPRVEYAVRCEVHDAEAVCRAVFQCVSVRGEAGRLHHFPGGQHGCDPLGLKPGERQPHQFGPLAAAQHANSAAGAAAAAGGGAGRRRAARPGDPWARRPDRQIRRCRGVAPFVPRGPS